MTPPTPSTQIQFQYVVIVQLVTSSRYGDIWVQDSGGGQYSGIHLFCNYGGSNPSCSMTKAQVDALHRGQVVNVSGKYDPYTPSAPVGAPTQIEISAPMITPTGSMATPTATDVAASIVAKGAAMSGATAYEGVYVRVTPGPFMINNTAPLEFEGTCPIGDGGMTSFGVEATGQSQTLAVALKFHTSTANPTSLSWCLSGCFTCTTNVLSNQSFSTISGILEPDSSSGTNSIYLEVMPTVDTDFAQ
jgi:hypothetical protein